MKSRWWGTTLSPTVVREHMAGTWLLTLWGFSFFLSVISTLGFPARARSHTFPSARTWLCHQSPIAQFPRV
jgi:hypothetical protein